MQKNKDKMIAEIMEDIRTLTPIINRHSVSGSLELRQGYTTYRDVASYGFINCYVTIQRHYSYNYPSVTISLTEEVGTNYNPTTPTRIPAENKEINLISCEEDSDERMTLNSYFAKIQKKLQNILSEYGSVNR